MKTNELNASFDDIVLSNLRDRNEWITAAELSHGFAVAETYAALRRLTERGIVEQRGTGVAALTKFRVAARKPVPLSGTREIEKPASWGKVEEILGRIHEDDVIELLRALNEDPGALLGQMVYASGLPGATNYSRILATIRERAR